MTGWGIASIQTYNVSSASTTDIPFVDLIAQYNRYRPELEQAMREVLETAAFIGGPALARFEAAFAQYIGVGHAVGVANGTDALELALRTAGVGPGDEVILPTNTFIATAEAISAVGARPSFVDVDEEDLLLDLEKAKEAVNDKTKAIIPVHLYGQMVPMEPVLAFAKAHNLIVIEDAAQAHGAEDAHGKKAGSLGDFGCFSFYPGKNLGAYGDGGAVVTRDGAHAKMLRVLSNHGRGESGGHTHVGRNSRLDGLQAAILDAKLKHLDTFNRERREAAARYDALLEGVPGITRPHVRALRGHVFHLYVIRFAERDALRAHLGRAGISTGIHYADPLHLTPAYATLGYPKGSFPVAEKAAREIVSLPISPDITQDQQARVADSIREFLKGAS